MAPAPGSCQSENDEKMQERQARFVGTAEKLDRIVYQIEESLVGATRQAYCPELVITAFGDTPEEARASLRAEIAAYLEDCEKLGILDDVLIDAGFYDNDEVWMSSLVTPPREPRINFL